MAESEFRPISDEELKELGHYTSLPEPTDENFDYYRKYLPPVVITECINGFSPSQAGRQVNFEQNKKYVMNTRTYRNLFFFGETRLMKPADIKFRDVYKPYIGQDLTSKTILIYGTGGFGDLIMLQPCLIYLKNKYPTCKIIFIFYAYHSLLKEWDFIDEILYENPLSCELLEQTDYHAFFENVIATDYAKKENQYRLCARWLGLDIPDELLVPKLIPNSLSLARNEQILAHWGIKEKSFIIMQIMSLSIIRSPNPLIWKKLIDKLTFKGHKIIITDQPARAKIIDNVIESLENKENVFNFAPYSATITDTIALASLAKLAITTDSALMHIAAGLDIKGFGICGSVPGELRLGTSKNCEWIDCEAPCAPCFPFGYEPCKNSINTYSSCYENLDIDVVLSRVEKLLD